RGTAVVMPSTWLGACRSRARISLLIALAGHQMTLFRDIAGVDPEALAYLNGAYTKIGTATVSVLDRGFIFGDGIYEVVPAYGGKPLRMHSHLQRLRRSLAAVRIENRLADDDWKSVITTLLSSTDMPSSIVYLQVTRGVAAREHAFPRKTTPTVLGMVFPFKPPSMQMRREGIAAASLDDIRWLRCDIKSTSM